MERGSLWRDSNRPLLAGWLQLNINPVMNSTPNTSMPRPRPVWCLKPRPWPSIPRSTFEAKATNMPTKILEVNVSLQGQGQSLRPWPRSCSRPRPVLEARPICGLNAKARIRTNKAKVSHQGQGPAKSSRSESEPSRSRPVHKGKVLLQGQGQNYQTIKAKSQGQANIICPQGLHQCFSYNWNNWT